MHAEGISLEKEADAANRNEEIRTVPILISFLIAGFVGLFGETALNMALSDLIQIFAVSPSTIQWLTTGFLLTLGILVPVSGFLLQWFTTRQLFVGALLFSIVGTFIAAIAPSFSVLLLARCIQAMGTALLLPLMFNTILVIIPPSRRGATMGLIGLVIMFAPAVGPTLSGLIIQSLSWHWIFWISLPFFILALVYGMVYMQNVTTPTRPKIDLLSVLLSTLGFGGIVFGFSNAGEEGGWGNPVVLTSLVIGGIGLLLFVLRQLKMEQPMLNMRAFTYPMFVIGLLLVFVGFMVILSSVILLPLYLQNSLLLTTFAAGLILLPGGLINGLLSPLMGRLFDKYGPKWLVIPGLVVAVITMFFFHGLSTETPIWLIVALHIALMVGIAMVMMPGQTNGLNQLPPELYPDGTAIMNTLQQVAGAIGTAVAISIMAAGQNHYLSAVADPQNPVHTPFAYAAGVQEAFLFGLAAAIFGLIISLFIKRVRV
ncbi:DHA2 family efflux MFS transporter permease subunit [Brevibacillus panacihumi]|uniref:DHA2 family efflux MFS transporter permease subunit n=1 Tax=Brevibacillus panacihumi TaxID=497735 RepID=A0A3M8DBV8_9BACL|nr:DHA2 family efflux MFS transporter permease subunit [Brevibacillus panacihumi]RNB85522.1 DHA2 family efflux MFS transporter permease subunit [Brevibacillus panacihumi]